MTRYDVIEVDIETMRVTIMGHNLSREVADGLELMAFLRRGNDANFFTPTVAGKYQDGDTYGDESEASK